jgi:hypothetical protein|tara:strand:- start:93 stop:635 length:543 start_codon:yes stop_codon:yes gene_type:complete
MINISIKDDKQLEYIREQIKVLELKKSLSGKLMILNHRDIDIVLDENSKVITAYSKGQFSEMVYNTQNRFFRFLFEKGIIELDTVKGTNVFGAIAGSYSDEVNLKHLTEVVLYNIATFIRKEKEYMDAFDREDAMEQDRILDPDAEESTELGEVPQEPRKGTNQPSYPGYYYGLAGIYRY